MAGLVAGLLHTLPIDYILCCVLWLCAMVLTAFCGTFHSLVLGAWCLLVRIIEPSNQSRRDPGVHMVIDGTCQVARQCPLALFHVGNANKRVVRYNVMLQYKWYIW